MRVIGLTGPSGAGKGEVAHILASYGIPVLDCDAIYHDLIQPPSPCLDALRDTFGDAILAPDGTLARAALAARVFAPGHEDERNTLNQITHFYVLATCRGRLRALRETGAPFALIDAPLLFESGLDRDCDLTIAVLAEPAARLARIAARDGMDEDAARLRLAAQPPDTFYREHADRVIDNNGSLAALTESVSALWQSYRKETTP